jgi:hypothetical protein
MLRGKLSKTGKGAGSLRSALRSNDVGAGFKRCASDRGSLRIGRRTVEIESDRKRGGMLGVASLSDCCRVWSMSIQRHARIGASSVMDHFSRRHSGRYERVQDQTCFAPLRQSEMHQPGSSLPRGSVEQCGRFSQPRKMGQARMQRRGAWTVYFDGSRCKADKAVNIALSENCSSVWGFLGFHSPYHSSTNVEARLIGVF